MESSINRYPSGYFRQELIFDFFNYAGIHRSVSLLSLPRPHVTGLLLHPEVVTRLDGTAVGNVWYVVESSANTSGLTAANVSCAVKIFDKDGTIVFESGPSFSGTAALDSPRLWWPIGSETHEVGHMYQLEVRLQPLFPRGELSEQWMTFVYRSFSLWILMLWISTVSPSGFVR